MKTTLHTDWTVGDISKGFIYDKNEGKGLFGLDGQLVIQPEYQRNYIYGDGKKDVAIEKGFTLVKAKVGEMDHVHCFISAPPKLSVTDIARWLKGISGRHLLMEFPEVKDKLWHGHLWNGSYFAESIGSTSEENILRYIERQKNVQM